MSEIDLTVLPNSTEVFNYTYKKIILNPHAAFFKITFYSDNNSLPLWPPNYSIWIFTHLTLCLADAIHNVKWVKIIQMWQIGGQLFSNIADWCHILSLSHV